MAWKIKKTRPSKNNAYMQLRNGKIVGFTTSTFNEFTGGTPHVKPGNAIMVTDRGTFITPQENMALYGFGDADRYPNYINNSLDNTSFVETVSNYFRAFLSHDKYLMLLKGKKILMRTIKTNEELFRIITFLCAFGLLCFAIFLLLHFQFNMGIFSAVKEVHFPRPEEVGLRNSKNIFLQFPSKTIPAWHVLPSSYKGPLSLEALRDGSAAFLHLRNTSIITSKHRVQVYDTLSNLGYHVIIPVFQLNDAEVKMAWKWLYKRIKSSEVFLWGDNITPKDLNSLGNSLCEEGVSPAGVIIETQVPNFNAKVTTMEVWGSTCKSLIGATEKYHAYVKCAIPQFELQSLQKLYSKIAQCMHIMISTY